MLEYGKDRRASRRVSIVAFSAVLVVIALFNVAVARADYGQVPEYFGVSGEAEQLERAKAIAVNATGAGGVEAGSFYVVG